MKETARLSVFPQATKLLSKQVTYEGSQYAQNKITVFSTKKKCSIFVSFQAFISSDSFAFRVRLSRYGKKMCCQFTITKGYKHIHILLFDRVFVSFNIGNSEFIFGITSASRATTFMTDYA